jgi:hypothetical protein
MWDRLDQLVRKARDQRWLNLCVVNLRILIGFAFLPASLKKMLGQPFTDPDKSGIFHEFLHAFHDVGGFYHFVGGLQFLAAVLLITQRFAVLGAVLALPMLFAIGALCWSSAGIPTTTVVTLMTLGTIGLLLWDFHRWGALFLDDGASVEVSVPEAASVIDRRLWQHCGTAILLVYLAASALHGGIYRPRGVELDNPAFYLLPFIALFPFVTWLIDRARYRDRRD